MFGAKNKPPYRIFIDEKLNHYIKKLNHGNQKWKNCFSFLNYNILLSFYYQDWLEIWVNVSDNSILVPFRTDRENQKFM